MELSTHMDRDRLQALLVELWQEKLGLDTVGVNDDFFELGGHSLLAADLMLDIYERVGVEVSAWTLFLRPTIAELAQEITGESD
ncbi:phosphopantetheine-binding protein [Allorhizocola rhizosphaerae]|uniref:phosphopantetheine-binding protein n=1 Tax=Allorhizocola rhizosphaerae TaxID=1872709 RepID=UPI000E3E7111|nr:phosphopantetheine-binding protein [Allorhizocola rhizosphaerae]